VAIYEAVVPPVIVHREAMGRSAGAGGVVGDVLARVRGVRIEEDDGVSDGYVFAQLLGAAA